MAEHLLRFIHASDFHLEQPILGLSSTPDHLRDLLVDAPYGAAQRVFESAVMEEVDFVVLSGDLLDVARSGPRGIAFLLSQFELLHEHGIAVYWAGGKADPPERWPAAARLPASVHLFSTGKVEELSHFRHDAPLATILGRSSESKSRIRPADFRIDTEEEFTIAVAYGEGDVDAMARQGIGYWALGGRHTNQTLCESPPVVRYSGSPQARTPRETGPHGGTLVTVDFDRRITTKLIPADEVRWVSRSLSLSDDDTRDVLEALLAEQMSQLAAEASGRTILAQWTLEAPGPLGERLRRGLAAELTGRLQNEFGRQQSPVWTVAIECATPKSFPDRLLGEDTILGEFLRDARNHLTDDELPLSIGDLLGEGRASEVVSAVLDLASPATRQSVLREAAVLGIDLLRGGEANVLPAAEETSK